MIKLGLALALISLPLSTVTPAAGNAAAGTPTPARTSASALAARTAANAAPAPARSVFVTNIVSNDISTFAIQPNGGLKLSPERTRTDASPRGIAVAPDGRTAYVANGIASTITAYRIRTDGGLTALPPPTPTDEDPDDAVVSPDGRRLYVVNRTAETVSMFPIKDDGTLTSPGKTVPVGGENPRGIATTPDGRFVFVSTGNPLDTAPDQLITFAVHADDGTLTRIAQTGIGAAGGAMALTPDGKYLYVPCSASHEVFGFRVGSNGDLTSVPGSPFFAPDVPIAAAMTPDGRNLYVTDGGLIGSGSQHVSAYTVRHDGSLVHDADVTAGDSPVGGAVTPDGRNLYVSNLDSDNVSAFRIAPGGGLTEIAGSPFPTGGEQPAFQSIAVRPNQGPVAALSVTGGAHLDASASSDPDGRVVRYDWDFGDGTTRLDGGPRPAHRFPGPGTYKVTVTVTDNEGCSTEQIFTGTSALCNGSARARASALVPVPAQAAVRLR
ncbi:beta-propeller fold lactonase family protein [Spirillospora sp. NPDC048911]|uniref:beta-propeller fold lactonase family protein n=1 Tax=Spirillospora sp. NPDC048911 TaxID=3364527 RepID=UPI00371196CA